MATGNRGRPLPKFGEWDASNPASAEGFTVIFNKARDDKKTRKPLSQDLRVLFHLQEMMNLKKTTTIITVILKPRDQRRNGFVSVNSGTGSVLKNPISKQNRGTE